MPAFRPNGIITLTSDFGTLDGYVGAMKGVILQRFSGAKIVDLTHDVPAQDIRCAARALANSCPYFPSGTVHVAVVDPGVGTSRAPIVTLHDGQVWVVPDNGVISQVVPQGAPAWRIERTDLRLEKMSGTFHGRDLFAPTAAALASGRVAPDAVGMPHEPLRLRAPELHRGDRCVHGEVIAIDRFGNLVTNIPLAALPGGVDFSRVTVRPGERTIHGISWSYADVDVGEWVAVIGSSDTVEVSVRDGNAAERGGLRQGAAVTVCWHPHD